MSEFGIFTAQKFREGVKQPEPIIEGILWEKDTVMMAAGEKSGKSIWALQLAYAVSVGGLFLDKFPVKIPHPVLYVQCEGKRSETVRRMDMMDTILESNQSNLFFMFAPFLGLNDLERRKGIYQLIDSLNVKPKLIILDPLYTTVTGDINENLTVQEASLAFAELKDRYNSALFIPHHLRKSTRDKNGLVIPENEGDIFGSRLWNAQVDHILFANMNKKTRDLVITCETQRTSMVIEKMVCKLHQPDPLYFELKDYKADKLLEVRQALSENPKNVTDLIKEMKLSKSTILRALKQLETSGDVTKLLDGKYGVCN